MMCAMSDPTVGLEQFSRADLETVEPWFEDRQTRRFLGGPGWPARMVELDERRVAGEEFRGARQTGAYRYLAHVGGAAVGYVDCGTFDRWTICEQGPGGDVVVSDSIDVPVGSIAFVIAPDFRGRGLGRTMISALISRPGLGAVELLGAGVEPENASARCLRAAGFRLQAEEPDFEGMLYYLAGPILARQPAAV
jgi:RimJ/RimL family protein N-acetyltransferase